MKQYESILVVDDDPLVCNSLRTFLKNQEFDVQTAQGGFEALELMADNSFDLALVDVSMPDLDGMRLLQEISAKYPDTIVVLITGYGSIEDAVNAIKYGAYEYVTKPIIDTEVNVLINRALEHKRLRRENEELRAQVSEQHEFSSLIGHQERFQRVIETIRAVAPTDATVLITGENGTGKSLCARAIHYSSLRKDRPFVEISCGVLSENLLESELFGHVKGSFTGAIADKVGKFEAAAGGTVFLDEVDTLAPHLQVKLLRVLQERRFERVGSNKTTETDVRLISAANRDLKKETEEGRFRQDLYYRLNVVSIWMPPLRDRVSDIPLLLEHFIHIYNERMSKQVKGVSDEARDLLLRYAWPGNVRELENAVESSIVFAQGEYLTRKDMPPTIQDFHDETEEAQRPLTFLKAEVEKTEREVIKEALKLNKDSRGKTCKMLGITRSTLYNKMRQYNLC